MEELEGAVNHRLNLINNLLITQGSPSDSETYIKNEEQAKKYKKDIKTLMCLIQNAYLKNDWSIYGFKFESNSVAEYLNKLFAEDQSSKATNRRMVGGSIQVSINHKLT